MFARLSLARFALRHGSLERPRPAAARRGGGGRGTGKVIVRDESREGSAAASMEVPPQDPESLKPYDVKRKTKNVCPRAEVYLLSELTTL